MVSTVAPDPSMSALSTLAPALAGPATCPACHTADLTMTASAVAAGADWRCARCGQRWDARRLATVAAYALWQSKRTVPASDHASLGGR